MFAALDENPTTWDSASNNTGTSWGGGVHVGLLWLLRENHTRVGLNYQSSVSHQFHGNSSLTGPLADPTGNFNPDNVFLSNQLVSNNIQFPNIVTLSGYHDVNEAWALLGSVVFTGWNTVKEIALDNVAGFNPIASSPELIDFVSTETYRNAWRGALGVNYKINDKWLLRAGGGYDQTPTINAERTVRMPDADRWALSIGAHYQPHPQWVIDAGYTYLQSVRATVDKTIALGSVNSFGVNAAGHSYVSVVGAQIKWLIDKPRCVDK